jgi:Protein of unknown function (DUF3102)
MSLKELDLPNQELRALEGAVADAQAVSLDELAATIRTADQGVAQTATYIKELALAAGDALLKAKEKLEHGKWLPWIKEKCDLSERRAQRYMHLAENRAVLEANPTCVSDLTLAQAERLIKESKRAAPGDASAEVSLQANEGQAAQAIARFARLARGFGSGTHALHRRNRMARLARRHSKVVGFTRAATPRLTSSV